MAQHSAQARSARSTAPPRATPARVAARPAPPVRLELEPPRPVQLKPVAGPEGYRLTRGERPLLHLNAPRVIHLDAERSGIQRRQPVLLVEGERHQAATRTHEIT